MPDSDERDNKSPLQRAQEAYERCQQTLEFNKKLQEMGVQSPDFGLSKKTNILDKLDCSDETLNDLQENKFEWQPKKIPPEEQIKYTDLVYPNPLLDKQMGIRLNSGKLRWRNFPLFLVEPLMQVGAKGEKHPGNPDGKYETYNFLKGMYVNDCMDSLKRHLVKFEDPNQPDDDHETQASHLAHIAWNALVALYMMKTRPELDDRYKG